jgi:nucleoside-diphosphate-sugar epimerase
MNTNTNNIVSIFGGSGFIGSQFGAMYNNTKEIEKTSNIPIQNSDVLYLISTTDNYNVFHDPHLDINTNLCKLMDVLIQFRSVCEHNTFNFISSWFVYGDTDFPAKEDSACNPKGFYSITKRTAEQLVISFCETFGLKYRILRLCNTYGENATKVSKKRNALQFMVNKIINNEDIQLYNDGSDVRDFMHVEDACRAIKLCMDKAEQNTIINIGSGIPLKFRPILQYVKDKTKSNSNFISIDPPDFHKIAQVKDMYLDITKLSELGFKQKIPIHEGLDRIMRANYE